MTSMRPKVIGLAIAALLTLGSLVACGDTTGTGTGLEGQGQNDVSGTTTTDDGSGTQDGGTGTGDAMETATAPMEPANDNSEAPDTMGETVTASRGAEDDGTAPQETAETTP